MTLKTLSKQLARKLGDPVLDGADDGRIYNADIRMEYLNRAILSLVKALLAVRSKLTNVFPDYYKIIELGEIKDSSEPASIALGDNIEIIGVYYSTTEGGDADTKANELSPELYYEVKLDRNSHYNPTTDNRYVSKINNSLYFLPANLDYFAITLIAVNEFKDLTIDETVKVSGQYIDLLLLYATQEGLVERGNIQKSDLYEKLINSKLLLIKGGDDKENTTGIREGDQ